MNGIRKQSLIFFKASQIEKNIASLHIQSTFSIVPSFSRIYSRSDNLSHEQIPSPASITETSQAQHHKTKTTKTLRQEILLQNSIPSRYPKCDIASFLSKDISFKIYSHTSPNPIASSEPVFTPANAI
jgi:hypothetical protein